MKNILNNMNTFF